MPNTNHIEVIDNFDRQLREGTVTNTDVHGIDQYFDDMYNNGTADVRGRLARLRQHIDRHLAPNSAVTTDIRQSLQNLRDTMDRRYVMANHPESNTLGIGNYVEAGVNRYALFERENLPMDDSWQSFGARWAVRAPILAAGASAIVGLGYLGYRWIIRPLGSVGTAIIGVGATIGSTIAAFSWLPENVRNNIRNMLPTWLRSTPAMTPEQTKKLEDQRLAQEAVTDTALASARDRLRNPNPIPPAQEALKQITAEMTIIQSLTQIPSLAADRQTLLTARRTTLENARSEMQVITRETPTEILQAVTKVINALDSSVSNLLNPPTERLVAGVRIRFESNAILLDGRRLVIEASRFGSPWLPVTLNTMRRNGANLQANATARFIGFPITRNPVFTPEKLAEALNRYNTGGLPYEEDETDANNRPTGVRLKFSLAA